MKIHLLFILLFSAMLVACNQDQQQKQPASKLSVKKLVGVANTRRELPNIIYFQGAHAPKIVPAGKPTITPNPNADGLGDPDFTYYTTSDGLALDGVTCSLIDKKGNLWFGSVSGLSRYDGKKFATFGAVNGLDPGVYSMVQDAAGNIWTNSGTDGNDDFLYKYDGSKFSLFSLPNHIDDNFNYMFADKAGNIWIPTNSDGTYEYRLDVNNKLARIAHLDSSNGLVHNNVLSFTEDNAGNFWFGTSGGVSKFNGKNFVNYTKANGLINNNINCIEEDKEGNMWFGTDSGISKFNGENFINFTTQQGLVNNKINVITADSYGDIWIGTPHGLSKYGLHEMDGQPGFTNYTKANGLSDNNIITITEGPTGNIWLGTGRGGICKYNRNFLTKYSASLGLTGIRVNVITQDNKGNFWFGTQGGGVCEYDGKNFMNYTTKQGLAENDVYSILQDKTGNIWFGCIGAISKYDGKTFTNFSSSQGLPSYSQIWNSIEDREGNLWFSSWGGLFKYDGKSFTNYTSKQGLFSNQTLSVIQDKKGNMWFSGYGADKWNEKTVMNYTFETGMPSPEMPGLREDQMGNIWIGTYGKGLCRIYNDSLTVYTTTQGLGDNTIFSIWEDKMNHRLWFGTNSGLSMLDENDLLKNNGEAVHFENFNNTNGYNIKDFSFNFSLFVDSKGVVWGGTGDGKLFRFDYDKIKPVNKPYHVQLQNIAVNNENICWNLLDKNKKMTNVADSLTILNEMVTTFGKVLSEQESKQMVHEFNGLKFESVAPFYPIPQNLILPYKLNNIRIDFAAIEPGFDNRMKYQYMLEGYDKTWSPLSNRSSVSFGNISEGSYTFKVKAVNPFNVWAEADYTFKVLPPWYRSWWAYCFYILLFLAAAYAANRTIRKRILEKEKVKAKERELEHAKEIEKAYHELKSTQAQLIQSEKMASLGELTAGIAHEIQNPLNFVNNFSEVNKELLVEMKDEMDKGNTEDAKAIANDVIENSEKINHHGKRADAIVKGMLQHSRSSTGVKELTNINALADEYLRLAYHGLRAKDKEFNATMKTDFDTTIGKINIVPQDIGRVLLNLYNNAFYAVKEQNASTSSAGHLYEPTVSVTTKKSDNHVIITVSDNGNGIPKNIVDKIFQPFFTTKPTGEGTGLGLSLSYDIIKAHGGEIKVETKEGEGSEFIIQLPIV
ncbi:MAG TPA: two-component regulator propeller domain-containing protein [Ginsengibacter sp.]